MAQPPGFKDPQHPDWVCCFTRAIYGLKQSPHQWNLDLNSALLSLDLSRSAYDPSLYYRLDGGNLIGAVTAHVYNLAIVGTSSFVTSFTKVISKRFKVGSNKYLSLFLSISISCDMHRRSVSICQSH